MEILTIFIPELYLMLNDSEGKKESQWATSKRSILFANSSLTYIQLGELQKNIKEMVGQNREKYLKICQHKADFNYQLYKTGEFQANSKAFGKELLLRQLDRLLEQKNYLDRELSLIQLEDEEQNSQKEQMVCTQTTHFELLKSIWRKDGNRPYEGVLEHMEELNLMVAQIRSNIHSLIKFESNDRNDFEDTYLHTFQTLRHNTQECAKCHEKQARVEYLQQKVEALEEKLASTTDQNILYLQEINQKEDKLKKQQKQQIKAEAELKDKILRLEQEILKKDQTLRQLKKQISELHANKFVNQEEGYQLIITGTNLDLGKYHKQITIPCEALMTTIAHELQNELKATQNGTHKRNSHRSQAETTEDSKNQWEEREVPVIKVWNPVDGERRNSENVDKKRLYQKSEGKARGEDSDPSCKRYVRTSVKRGHLPSFSVNQPDEASSQTKSRGASPIDELLIE